MQPGRYVVLFPLLALLGLSWILLVALQPDGGPNQLEHLIVGYLLGTMFGQATLASAWMALGPAPLLWRLPLSLGWIAVLSVAFMISIAVHGHGGDIEIALVMAACLGGIWLLVQAPLWGLAVGYGVRLRHRSDPPETNRERQFGIRQLMILTAIVAVVLGAGRWIAGAAAVHFRGDWDEIAVFAFLTVAGIVMTLPLLLAALLPRFAWLASAVVLGLIAIGTWYELPLIMMIGGRGGGPDIWHLTFINAFQALSILAVTFVVRICGYGIKHPPRGESPFASSPAGEIREFSPPPPKFSSPPVDK
jgi:hypothetical protein